MRVYILLYNSGTNNEGIHTLQVGDRNKILMFEAEEDAARYALLLEAQDFPNPSVEAIDSEEVEAFCRKADYDCEIVEAGKLAVPPERNVEKPEWQESESSQETASAAETSTTEASEMSQAELDRLRRQLEGLL